MKLIYEIFVFGEQNIFKDYDKDRYKKGFEHYFNICLNPDNAPVGFLERLDTAISFLDSREIVFCTSGKELELLQIKVLKDYFDNIPPF